MPQSFLWIGITVLKFEFMIIFSRVISLLGYWFSYLSSLPHFSPIKSLFPAVPFPFIVFDVLSLAGLPQVDECCIIGKPCSL